MLQYLRNFSCLDMFSMRIRYDFLITDLQE